MSDGSTDDTEEVVKKINDPRIRFLKLSRNKRKYPPNLVNHYFSHSVQPTNFGLKNMKGDISDLMSSAIVTSTNESDDDHLIMSGQAKLLETAELSQNVASIKKIQKTLIHCFYDSEKTIENFKELTNDKNTNFDDALKQAQDLGLAEADPTMDIDGTDAAQKASILAALAFKVPFDFKSVSYGGIDQVDPEDLKFAAELGYAIKHIAYGSLIDEEVSVSAYPTLVSKELLLSQVGQQMNALDICCEDMGSTVYYGPGAGPKPTASAVIADLVDIANGGWPSQDSAKQVNKITKTTASFPRYLRLNVKNEPGAIAKISSIFANEGISIEALIQHEARKLPEDLQDTVPVVIISGSVSEEIISKLITNLESMKEIDTKVRQFRIHNAV